MCHRPCVYRLAVSYNKLIVSPVLNAKSESNGQKKKEKKRKERKKKKDLSKNLERNISMIKKKRRMVFVKQKNPCSNIELQHRITCPQTVMSYM